MPRLKFLDWALTYRYIRDKVSSQVQAFSLQEYPWLTDIYILIGQGFQTGKYSQAVIRKAAHNTEIRDMICGMMANAVPKKRLLHPLFYLKLLFK